MMNDSLPLFVKWAGGKKQLIDEICKRMPVSFENYIEPFVGGGSILFWVLTNKNPKRVIIGDTNAELINAYEQIRDNVEAVIKRLRYHEKNHSFEHYHIVRGLKSPATTKLGVDNSLWVVSDLSPVERAARFIYLNRTCFNGLYRVNAKGMFNVPMGQYKNPAIVREDILRRASALLQPVETFVQDFEKIAMMAHKGDFVYFDPPYDPLSETSNFTSYTHNGFGKEEQKRLSDVFARLAKKGVFVMKSNHNTLLVRELFSSFNMVVVNATRMINSDSSGRGTVEELIITSYKPK